MSSKPDIHPKIQLSEVAVVIAARNEEKTAALCLESVLKSAKGEAEVFFIDDGSTDRTAEIARSFSGVQALVGGGKGPGHARNLGMRSGTRPYVAFVDADAIVAPDWLEKLIDGLSGRDTVFVAIGGPQRTPQTARPMEREMGEFLETVGFVSDYIHNDLEIREVAHNPTCNVLYLKTAVLEVGGFDENLWPTEDLDLDLTLRRRGYRCLFTPFAVVEHDRPESASKLFAMMKRYGYAHSKLVRKRGFCQPLHGLPFFILGLGVICVISPTKGLALLSVGIFGCWLAFGIRVKDFAKAVRFTGYLTGAVSAWTIGFFSGIFNSRRIATINA